MTMRPKDTQSTGQYIGVLGYHALWFQDDKSFPKSQCGGTLWRCISLMKVIGFLSPWKLTQLVPDASQQEDDRGQSRETLIYLRLWWHLPIPPTILGKATLEETQDGKGSQGAFSETIPTSCCY